MRRGALIPDRSIALLLGVATAMSRLPFVAERLWEWDSVLYARALEHGFHVDDVLAGSRPHPPGYIFYVGAAAIGRAFGLDSEHALAVVSVLASGAAVAVLYLLCRRFADRSLSLGLAAAFATSPLVWLHGEVAMPYILLAPISAFLALAFRDARGRGARRVAAVSFAFGVLGGFRQDLLLFLFPLWVWMVLPASSRTRLGAVAALGAGCLAWFVPSAALSDGPAAYVSRSLAQLIGLSGASANSERSIPLNLVLVADSLWWAGPAVAVLVLVLGLARALASLRGQHLADDREATFFGLWLVPALLFYLVVHIGEWGFVLSLAPGVFALAAWLLRSALARVPSARPFATAALLASAVGGGALFLVGDHPVFSHASLVAHDRATAAKTAYIREHLPAGSTVILAAAEALVASYYAPGDPVRYSSAASTASYDLPVSGPTTLVVYEPAARPAQSGAARVVTLAHGVTLELIDVPAGTVRLHGTSYGDLRR